MYTLIKTKEGSTLNFTTQEYVTGLYIIINSDSSQQGCLQTEETPFHVKLRKKALKNGDTIVEGTILNTKDVKLNEFGTVS